MHGRGALIQWLLENDLVDETLLIVPVVLGQGTRLFPATGPDYGLQAGVTCFSRLSTTRRPAGR